MVERRPASTDYRDRAMESEDIRPDAVPVSGNSFVVSEELFKDRRVVLIHHNGQVYRLQETRAGKLILTK